MTINIKRVGSVSALLFIGMSLIIAFQNFTGLPSSGTSTTCTTTYSTPKLHFSKTAASFVTKSTGNQVSGTSSWRLGSTGALYDSITLPNGSELLVEVQARNDLKNGGGAYKPNLQILVGEMQIANFSISSATSTLNETARIAQPGLKRRSLFKAGTYELKIAYTNDWSDGIRDRGVIVDFVKIRIKRSGCTGFESRYSGMANANNLATALAGANSAGKVIGATLEESKGVSPYASDIDYKNLISNFDYLSPTNQLKSYSVRMTEAPAEYSRPDAYFQTVAENGSAPLYGHTLVWHKSVPTLQATTNVLSWVSSYITGVVGRYKERVLLWDVVNEPLTWEGKLQTNSYWYQTLGSNYIADLTKLTASLDPNTPMIINENQVEDLFEKSDGLLALVNNLRAQGIQISGVGIQAHIDMAKQPNLNAFKQNLQRFASAGFDIHITELDVRLNGSPTAQKLEAQADLYYHIVALCMEQVRCRSLSFWTPTDKYTWVPTQYPGLLDANFVAKPALGGAVRGLNWRPGAVNSAF